VVPASTPLRPPGAQSALSAPVARASRPSGFRPSIGFSEAAPSALRMVDDAPTSPAGPS
jgi:hypothetical protein